MSGRADARAASGTTTSTRVPLPGFTVNRQRSVHFPDDGAANRQAQAVAVRLRREKRLEHPRQILGGIPHPESAIGDLDARPDRWTPSTVIRPPCGMASRALVSRLRKTCSRSLWLQATAGRSSGTVDGQLDAAACPSRTSGSPTRFRWRAAPARSPASPRRAPRKRSASRRKSGGTPGATSERARGPRKTPPVLTTPPRSPPASAGPAAASPPARCSHRAKHSGPDPPSHVCARRSARGREAIRCDGDSDRDRGLLTEVLHQLRVLYGFSCSG